MEANNALFIYLFLAISIIAVVYLLYKHFNTSPIPQQSGEDWQNAGAVKNQPEIPTDQLPTTTDAQKLQKNLQALADSLQIVSNDLQDLSNQIPDLLPETPTEAPKSPYTIQNHYLYKDGTPIRFHQTPNVSTGTINFKGLVMHFTGGTNSESWLTNKYSNASAHILINRKGEAVQLAPFNAVTWHAGTSQWQDLQSLNRYCVGIELENLGGLQWDADKKQWYSPTTQKHYADDPSEFLRAKHRNEVTEKGWQLFTPEQLLTARQIATALYHHYALQFIVGHDDIAPNRKIDPGPAFPMTDFQKMVIEGNSGGNDNAPQLATHYQTTAKDGLNLRKGASTTFEVITKLPYQTTVILLQLQSNDTWAEVVAFYPNEEITRGFVSIKYLEQIT